MLAKITIALYLLLWLVLPPAALAQQANCENSPTSRGCWGEYNISTDYHTVIPNTGVTREYWLVAENHTLAPDGHERQVLVFNGTLPGPLIEANWGDELVIHVTNALEHNGTAIHWHGIWQRNSNHHDGVPGVTQCPIPPTSTQTYRFRATQYGTSWYHSHFSLQMADGLYGPILIHGPNTANYDVDLGPIFITDWYHKSAFILWEEHTRYGGVPVRANAVPATGLLNGTNLNFNPCQAAAGSPTAAACTGTGRRFEVTVERGKKYLLRLIDSSVDGWMKFNIDGHRLTVVAADFVPIVPYETEAVILTSGQRYDVIFEASADEDVGGYWMRAIFQTACNGLEIENADIRGIVRYAGAKKGGETSTSDPTTTQWESITNSCGDEPYDKLVPWVRKTVGRAAQQESLKVGWFYETDLVFHWTLNSKDLLIDWSQPTDLRIWRNESVFPSRYNVFEIEGRDRWTYWVIQDLGFVNAYHPFHLHGHDFFILAEGRGLYTPLVRLNRDNPPRRDTATMAGSGYLVIAFESDNPGSWLMHCHIAWHASQGLALQFVERESEIRAVIEPGMNEFEDICEEWNEYWEDAVYHQDDSGI
ncbi:multicopper oxidase-domain-containing protein [Aspergillus karnatakaensis]|uniref:multicopper oxidase-domain-containing protein n=1 Tax=Aspergillus karnatakaensis TaxID=1810916 RepID=UPI003CCCBB3F